MKKLYLFLLCFFSSLLCEAQVPSFDWADGILGAEAAGINYDRSITTDAAGNVYVTGYFQGTVDFDPGPGMLTYTTPPVKVMNAFVVKLSSSGNLIWARILNSTGNSAGRSIAVNTAGNVFVTGYFTDTCDFDPGPGVYNIMSPSHQSVFVWKLDASGNLVFANALSGGNPSLARASAITVDAANNIYLTGDFSGTVDFDPGPAIDTLTATGLNLCFFVAKLDAGGNLLWAKQAQHLSVSSVSHGNSIALDGAGNVMLGGDFTSSIDFASGIVTDTLNSGLGVTAAFLLKLDNTGNFSWGKKIDCAGGAYSVQTDAMNNVYATGYFTGTVDFDPGAGTTLLNTGAIYIENAYILKLDAAGNFIWVRNLQNGDSEAHSLLLDAVGNIYLTGCFKGTVDFDPGAGTYNLTATHPGANDAFSMKLNAAGSLLWAGSMGGPLSETKGYSIAVDPAANAYTFGTFGATVDFDPGPDTAMLTAPLHSWNFFIQKMHRSISNGVAENENENTIAMYPNPTSDLITIANLTKPATIIVCDITGRILQSQKSNDPTLQLDLHAQAAGIYFVTVRTDNGNVTQKVVKQ